MGVPHFDIPLNLPHAATVAGRIGKILSRLHEEGAAAGPAIELTFQLLSLLGPCQELDDNPPPPESERIRQACAARGRQLVEEIESAGLSGDRIGQCIRNLFECLQMGEEGAILSLRAGEPADSLQRPI